MSVSKYEAFLKTVELGSLTRAADALGYTQSGMTYILNSLEDECGLTLLKRDRTGVQLTSDGQEMLPYIESLCESWRLVSEKRDALKGMESGHLRIGTFTSVSTHWLPGIIHAFRRAYPNITFELLHGDYAQIQEWVLRGRVDLGFTQLPLKEGLSGLHLKSDDLLAVLPGGIRCLKSPRFRWTNCWLSPLLCTPKTPPAAFGRCSAAGGSSPIPSSWWRTTTPSSPWWRAGWVSACCRIWCSGAPTSGWNVGLWTRR